MSDLGNMLRPLASKLGNMLARGKLTSVKAEGKMQVLQLALLDGEVKDRLEHFEPYGFTSHPNPGSAEAAAVFLDGDRSHGIVVVVADRKYRLKALEQGEMAIHDDQDQKVHLTRAGIVIEGGNLPIIMRMTPSVTIQADEKIRFETPLFEVAASTKVRFTSPLFEVTGLTQTQQLTIGLTGAGTATMTGGAINYQGVATTYTGGTIRHDGKNIGSSHTHNETGGTTLTPNP